MMPNLSMNKSIQAMDAAAVDGKTASKRCIRDHKSSKRKRASLVERPF